MSLIERVISNIKDRRQRLLDGSINSIPLPFNRFRNELPGIEQGKYILVSGATKSGKSQLTNYLFVYNTIFYAYHNRDKITPKIFYYALEETPENITLRFMSYLLYTLSGNKIRVSPSDLKSVDNSKPLNEEIIKLLESEEYQNILSFYEEVLHFQLARNPTAVWKDMKKYADENGTTYYKEAKYTDELGEVKTAKAFDYYIPNNPNEYIFIIIDHISLIEPEKSLDLRQSINKLSEYLIIFRNRYNYIPVVVQQQSLETTNLDAFKQNKIRPTMAGLSDSKYTGKDCNLLLGITNPYTFELPEYQGYDITKFKGNIRFMEIVLNRDGQSNGICPLFFDGATNFFSELPLPSDREMINNIYTYLNNIRNKVNKLFLIFSKKKKI